MPVLTIYQLCWVSSLERESRVRKKEARSQNPTMASCEARNFLLNANDHRPR